jgi:hypothetical protein
MAEMVKNLDSVPVKFKEVWVDASDEITLEELYEAEKTDNRLTRRIFPGLMASGDSYCTREIVANGVYYYLTEWTHFHEYEIQRRVRWNLIDDIAEKLTDNKSRKKKILYNPNKSSEKPTTQFFGVRTMLPRTRFRWLPVLCTVTESYRTRRSLSFTT